MVLLEDPLLRLAACSSPRADFYIFLTFKASRALVFFALPRWLTYVTEVLEGALEKGNGGCDGYVCLGTNTLKNIKSYRLFLFEKR